MSPSTSWIKPQQISNWTFCCFKVSQISFQELLILKLFEISSKYFYSSAELLEKILKFFPVFSDEFVKKCAIEKKNIFKRWLKSLIRMVAY